MSYNLQTKRFFAITLLVFAFVGSATVISAQDNEPISEDEPRVTRAQRLKIKRLNEEIKARIDRVSKDDIRLAAYNSDLAGLNKITNPVELKARVTAMNEKYKAFRAEMLQKAGINVKDYNLKLKEILPRIQLDDSGRIINRRHIRTARPVSGHPQMSWFQPVSYEPSFFMAQTQEITNFQKTWSFKDCSQARITFDSDKEFEIYASTQINKQDCDDVKAARGAVVSVPAGVKTVKVEITLDKYYLSTWAAPVVFSYAAAYSAVGIRVRGRIVGSVRLTNYFRHSYLDTYWSVIGLDEADEQETDAVFTCSFKPLVPGDFHIQAYGRVTADTDGWAYANGRSDVEGMQKMKVTFVR